MKGFYLKSTLYQFWIDVGHLFGQGGHANLAQMFGVKKLMNVLTTSRVATAVSFEGKVVREEGQPVTLDGVQKTPERLKGGKRPDYQQRADDHFNGA